MNLKIFGVVCVVLAGAATGREIPEYIHVCKRSDPEAAKCVRESIEVLRPRLRAGIPQISVPSLEPLHIKEVVIFRGESPNNFRAFLRNVQVHGTGDFQITKLKLNVAKNTYRIGVKIPLLLFDGDYEIDAKLLVVPIQGKGKFNANITEAEGQGVLKAEIIEIGGHREIRFKSFDFAIRIGDYNIHLDNLFQGDEILSEAANEVLHLHKQEFIQAALPFIQNKVSEILLEAANRITVGLDYDKIFPEK